LPHLSLIREDPCLSVVEISLDAGGRVLVEEVFNREWTLIFANEEWGFVGGGN